MRYAAVACTVALLSMIAVPPASADPALPYDTQIKADVANTRSGPGDYWYVTGKLKRGDTVTVVGHQFGFAEIKAVGGAHSSLIAVEDVDVSGRTGTVKGTRLVPVRAAGFGEKRVNRIQWFLQPGESVSVIGRVGDRYLQIAPPAKATVFVHASLLAEPGVAVVSDTPRVHPTTQSSSQTRPDVIAVNPPAGSQPEVTTILPPLDFRARLRDDDRLLKAEAAKTLLDRDYKGLLKRYMELKTDYGQSSPRVRQYAGAMIEWLQQQIRLQETVAVMAATRPDTESIIAEARRIAAGSGETPVEAAYQVTGVLRKSEAMGNSVALPNLHKIETGDGQKVICYVLPPAGADWASMVGKEVTIAGKKEYRSDWNFNLVRGPQIALAGGTIIQPLPMPIDVETDPSLIIDMIKRGLGPSTAPDSQPATPKRGDYDVLPPVVPLPDISPLPPASHPAD